MSIYGTKRNFIALYFLTGVAVSFSLIYSPLTGSGRSGSYAGRDRGGLDSPDEVIQGQAEVGDTRVFWAHNFQFFANDYRLGATLQASSGHGMFYVENAVVLSMAVDEPGNMIYIGTAHGGVFRRSFTGTRWINVSSGLPNDPDRTGKYAVNALVLTDTRQLLAGTDGGIYGFRPNTLSWANRGGIREAIFSMLADGDTVYAGLGGYVWDSADDTDEDGNLDVNMGVRVSYDGGATWSNSSISAGLPKVSASLPEDKDKYLVEVVALAIGGNYIYAATPGGVFRLERGRNYWRAYDRSLVLASPQVTVKLDESTRSEAERGDPLFIDWNRWLVVDTDAVSSETELTITHHDTTSTGADSISQWSLPLIDGILGDINKYMLDLNFNTRGYNVSPSFTGYDSLLFLANMRFLDADSVATVMNPRTQVFLLATDAIDTDYELGGQYATVTYDNDTEIFQWSAQIQSMREPNKDKRGIFMSDATLINGVAPDYLKLNRPDQLEYFSAVTLDNRNLFTTLASSTDNSEIYGLAGDVNSLFAAGSLIYAGTSTGVFSTSLTSFQSDATVWEALPYLLPYTPIAVHSIQIIGDNLYAGSDFGFYTIEIDPNDPGNFEGRTWASDNLELYSYIIPDELGELADFLNTTSPIDPSKGIYDIITETFGVDRLPDIDGTDVLTILLHDIHDISETWNNTSNGSEGGIDQIHGYVRPNDQSLSGRTNTADMVYIATKRATTTDRGGALAHQLVNLMFLKADLDEERWIKEGIAFLGEKLCGFPLPAIWADFAQGTNTGGAGATLISGTPTVKWAVNPNGGSSVGELHTKVALWMTYLYENLGGIDFMRALLDEEANGIEGIEAILPEGLTFNDLFTAWSVAYAVNDNQLSDPVTQLSYGFQDNLYTATLNAYRSGNGDSIGVRAVPLQPDVSMEEYRRLLQPALAEIGLNNWATVYRSFFNLPATGGPRAWAGKQYHLNVADDRTIAIWLLKHKTGGGFEVKPLTQDLNDENEITFDILAEFEPNADTTAYTFDKVLIGLSNQTRKGGSAKLVQTTDVRPPQIAVSLLHHAAYPEFVSFYVWADEHLHKDVDQFEKPEVFAERGILKDRLGVSLFHDVGNDSGSIYTGNIKLDPSDTLSLLVESVQDLAGNNTAVVSIPISLGKMKSSTNSFTLTSSDRQWSIALPAHAMPRPLTITLFQESPALFGLMKGLDADVLADAVGIYTVGPSGTPLTVAGEIIVALRAGVGPEDHIGIYQVTRQGMAPIPSTFDPQSGTIRATIQELGSFIVAKNAHLQALIMTIPDEYELGQNYPNPFNPSTSIPYTLPQSGRTRVLVYDVLGREVKVLADGEHEAGVYQIVWDGTDYRGEPVGSGVYFFTIQSKTFTATRKMILLK